MASHAYEVGSKKKVSRRKQFLGEIAVPWVRFPHHVFLLILTANQFGHPLLAASPCQIEVVEKGSDWPVPLVELETTSKVLFVTDNAGLVAFDLPEFMGRETWLTVRSHGYEMDKDGFGNRGFRFTPMPGTTKRIEIRRTNIAKRLGRLTGEGIFAESQKLGQHLDWQESGVVGQDTVEEAPFNGKIYWGWGDTGVFGYPLGLFKTAGATTPLLPLKKFEPPLELAFDYYRNPKGQLRNVIDIESPGPVWVGGYTCLPDQSGKDHLVCAYSKIKGFLSPVEAGLADWNDTTGDWKVIKVLWTKEQSDKPPLTPNNHSAVWTDPVGKKWVYFGDGLPRFRCPATFEAWQDTATWEKVTNPDSLVSAMDGKPVGIAAGTFEYNAWRKRWVTIIQQKFGQTSPLGEVWYAESDTPAGPWGKAVKVVSHNNYTFYNPMLHPDLVPSGAKFLLFEGTYTAEFANHPAPTPRYDYNQILYRLDLDDPELGRAQSK